jgi:hypothetical protein
MKDYELQMLTAFFAALTQQSEPLPADFVVQLNEISETLDLNQLNQLITNSSLGENYQIAYQRLRSKSSVRNLGLDTTPKDRDVIGDTNCTEVHNVSRRGTEQNADEIITQIETRLHEEETPTSLIRTICGNSNPIEAAKTILLTSGF